MKFKNLWQFFKEKPEAGISDLLSMLDKESASFIGALISVHAAIDEQNAIEQKELLGVNDVLSLRYVTIHQ